MGRRGVLRNLNGLVPPLQPFLKSRIHDLCSGDITEKQPLSDPTPAKAASFEQDIAEFLTSLSSWFGGMSTFLALSKREWRHASAAEHLMAQQLRRHTLRLKGKADALSARMRAQHAEQE